MKKCYVPKRFRGKSNKIIRQANTILDEYAAQGFILTLRQLFYQFVARDLIPNRQKSYKRLGDIIGDARLAGRIDWEYLEDRTRNLASLQHFGGPEDALAKLASWYHVDMWENQKYRPEVWIEKDALVGVIERVCQENDVPFFSCRGYTSLSEMWRASLRLTRYTQQEQMPYIIHLGDHDPSGMDMSRDIFDRINFTFQAGLEFKRVALNMDQIEQYKPPPNPAKTTDSRYNAYIAQYGTESWELDALDPPKFRELIEHELATVVDTLQWKKDAKEKARVKQVLVDLSLRWGKPPTVDEVYAQLNELPTKEFEELCRTAGLKKNGKPPTKPK